MKMPIIVSQLLSLLLFKLFNPKTKKKIYSGIFPNYIYEELSKKTDVKIIKLILYLLLTINLKRNLLFYKVYCRIYNVNTICGINNFK